MPAKVRISVDVSSGTYGGSTVASVTSDLAIPDLLEMGEPANATVEQLDQLRHAARTEIQRVVQEIDRQIAVQLSKGRSREQRQLEAVNGTAHEIGA